MLDQQLNQVFFLVQLMNLDACVVEVFRQYNLVGESLINQTFLPHSAVYQLLCVDAHQRVEKCIELIFWVVLRPHDPPHPLNLLPPRLEVHPYLNSHIGTGQINGRIAHSAQENYVNVLGGLENVINFNPLFLLGLSMDERKLQFFCIQLQYLRPIAKYEHFIIKMTMLFQQILQDLEFVGIGCVQKLTRIQSLVMLHEFIRHFAEHLDTIRPGQATFIYQIQPVLLEQFRPNHVKQVVYFVILPIGRCSQPYFQVKLVFLENSLECICWKLMHLIGNADSPRNLLRHFQIFVFHCSLHPHHRIGRDKDGCLLYFLRIRFLKLIRKHDDLIGVNRCPFGQLRFPLLSAYLTLTENDCVFLNPLNNLNGNERFPGSTGQNDDSTSSLALNEDILQGPLLVISQLDPVDAIYIDVFSGLVLLKIVLLDNRNIALDQELGHVKIILFYHALNHFHFIFIPSHFFFLISLLWKQIIVFIFISLQAFDFGQVNPVYLFHLNISDDLYQVLDVLVDLFVDKEIIVGANQRKFDLAREFHIGFDLLLQGFRELQVFAQLLQDLNDFLS